MNAGYQLGSRLVVKNDANSDRIGLRLTQSGAVVGIQRRFSHMMLAMRRTDFCCWSSDSNR